MRIAHAREVNSAAGAPWRLVAALDPGAADRASGRAPDHWIDLEIARRRAIAADPNLAHDRVLHRQPVTTLDDHLARGLRIEALTELVDGFTARGEPADDDALLEADDLVFGPPVIRPPSLRDFYAFEGHVRTMWERRGGEVPETWYRLPIFYFSNVSEIRGQNEPVWAPTASAELDYELEVAALIDTPVVDLAEERGEEAIGGYTIFNDWSARDLQREETVVRLGPAKGKDFASSFGPWLVTPDELAGARATGATGPDLAMTAEVNGVETSRGSWSDAQFSFGAMAARASADARLRPGDLLGSGTVGTGCLLEVKDATLGRYLEPGDEVVLMIDRLGALRTPVIARPDRR
ncbi:MAG: fumarylacetoacetate hydrolase family protein [Chloroflexi bacterium]|nr:fumarylacetoacetate hydrolase family protein [Chloroflexota bacterium]